MSKRARLDSEEDQSSGTTSMDTTASSESTGDDGVSGQKGSKGVHQFTPGVPLKTQHTWQKTYRKHFYFKIYANDWEIYQTTNPAGEIDLVGFMTVIPYQALCMYLSPNEYFDIVRSSAYARIKHTKFDLEFKAVRTPFDTNDTDKAEANGNLQFELQRWDGLEQVLPFDTVDVDFPFNNETVRTYKSYEELIRRLYGGAALGQGFDSKLNFPASMRERGLTYRPRWKFLPNATSALTSFGPMARGVNAAISAIPIGEYRTDQHNTNQSKMGEGYCFARNYQPKNGIIHQVSTAYAQAAYAGDNMYTMQNQKVRMNDRAANSVTSADAVQYITNFQQQPTGTTVNNLTSVLGTFELGAHVGTTSDVIVKNGIVSRDSLDRPGRAADTIVEGTNEGNVQDYFNLTQVDIGQSQETNGYGYNNSMMMYTLANIENFTNWTSNNDPPIHHMPSMMIGAIPKTTKDPTKIVNATFEFECTTEITISCQDADPTYINMAYSVFGEAGGTPGNYMDSQFNTNPESNLFGGQWKHNETDILNYTNKNWFQRYGRAGKMKFNDFDVQALL